MQIQIHFSKSLTRNIQYKIKQATCFGCLSHHQALTKDTEKIIDFAIGAISRAYCDSN